MLPGLQVLSLQLDAEEFAIQSHVLCWHPDNTEEMPSSRTPVCRKSGLAASNFLPLVLPMMEMVALWVRCNCTIIIFTAKGGMNMHEL